MRSVEAEEGAGEVLHAAALLKGIRGRWVSVEGDACLELRDQSLRGSVCPPSRLYQGEDAYQEKKGSQP